MLLPQPPAHGQEGGEERGHRLLVLGLRRPLRADGEAEQRHQRREAQVHQVEQARQRLRGRRGGGGGGGGGGGSGSSGGGGGGGSGGGMDASTQIFIKASQTLWKRLEGSSIEKVNVGQQEALGIKDLIKLSNEQIDTVTTEVL